MKNGRYYSVESINTEQRDRRLRKVDFSKLYSRKASIHGTCIKLFSDRHEIVDMWEENFHPMQEDIRPHGRIFAIDGKGKTPRVLYEKTSKTVFIYNCRYYGKIKSVALALCAQYLLDSPSLENRRYSIHGSFIDVGGRGVAIMGRPKAGKTTLTYGILASKKEANFLTDDWFFVRFLGRDIRAYSAEKNSYAGADIATNWSSLKERLKEVKKDNHGRSIVDVAHLFGGRRIRERSDIYAVVVLARDKKLPVWSRLEPKKALALLRKWDYCNPHQLLRSAKSEKEQYEFFASLLQKVPAYLLNTVEAPKQSLLRLDKLLGEL